MDSGLVRFGILGCARIARKLSRAILMTPGACLYAIGSRSLEKAQGFARDNGFPAETKIYASYQGLLDDEAVDAVYIPLPTALHVEWVLKAAEKKKHVLLEKPLSITIEDLEKIISACEKQGIQLMDGTMWMHHPRADKMKEVLNNKQLFGDLVEIHSAFVVPMPSAFFTEDIRVNPELDALGALGDLGWYCARAFLWATSYELPASVTALPGAKLNGAGVILSCGACLLWKDGRTATFHCSFLTNMTMSLVLHGTTGTIEVDDFVIPFKEDVAKFRLRTGSKFGPLDTSWIEENKAYEVHTSLPQECLMIQKFSTLVKGIRDGSGTSDPSWFMIARKTQQVLNAVKSSIEKGYTTVALQENHT